MPLLAARPAHAEPEDTAAKRLADSAMNDDYLGTRFKDAEKKLKKALKLCAKKQCSPSVVARVQRDLGVVYIAGMKRTKQGKAAFAKAIDADATIRLEPDVTTPEIEQAWKDVGGEGAEPEPVPEERVELDHEPEPKPEPKPEPVSAYRSNWFSLSVQQDFLVHGRNDSACGSGEYTCFDTSGAEYTAPIYDVYGNQVAPGIGIATTRLLLGYERLFLERVLLGARVGIAFGGAPTPSSGDKFLPLHFELRGSYFFGTAPFERRGLRPFASLGLGIAEVDGSVSIDYYRDEADFNAGVKGKLAGWRKTGKVFAAPTFGSQYAFSAASALTLELRALLMFGTSAFAPAVSVGYVHGI